MAKILRTLFVNYECETFTSLNEFQTAFEKETSSPDLLLADLIVPDGSFLDWLREHSQELLKRCPFIVLSGKHDEQSIRTCLEIGAVDYITKPFVAATVLVKVERSLKSTKTQDSPLQLDAATHSVRSKDSATISLTAKQFQILTLIHTAFPAPVSKDEIERVIWGKTKVNQGNLAVHLSLLRNRLRECSYDILRVEPASYKLERLSD